MAVILVVEDEVHVRLLLSEILRSLKHEVRLAATASEGIDLFRTEQPAAVVLDIRLPDASGMTVLDEMVSVRRDTPVIVVSGHADAQAAGESRRRGAFEFLAKPFSIDQFVRVMTAALHDGAPSADRSPHAGPT
jgi:two-component system response regulator AtoC